MFAGIITAIGEIRGVTRNGDGDDMRAIIDVEEQFLARQGGARIGASICCSGCCLTATELGPDWFAVDIHSENVGRTTVRQWRHGTRVNLERALRFGDDIGGHLVHGHVDGLAHIVEIVRDDNALRITFEVPRPLHRFIAARGLVAIDGISAWVKQIWRTQAGAEIFSVNIIPHTADLTTIGLRVPGDAVHIEVDILARYVARLTETA